MNNITLKKIRPWTITQADIEGYEDIHFEEREINYEIYKVFLFHNFKYHYINFKFKAKPYI